MAVLAMVEAGQVAAHTAELMDVLAPLFARVEPRRTCRDYVRALLGGLPRANCWTLAEQAGHAGPARQYTGTVGKVTNCVNAVYCTYATVAGHALCDVRLYLHASWADDQQRRTEVGVPEQVGFATKPQLAAQMLAEHLAAGTPFRWVAADSVYGRDSRFRAAGKGYVLQVPCDFRLRLGCGRRLRADQAAGLIKKRSWWNLRSAGLGTKGERLYRWGWVATASDRHSLLIRQSLTDPADLAYFWCHQPDDQPAPLPVLVTVAGMRWPVEEDFGHGKQQTGLDQSQVRAWRAWHLAYQEIWAWLCVHYALAMLIARAAEAADVDPDRISFSRTLRLVCRTATGTAGFPPEDWRTALPRILAELVRKPNPARRHRTCPRAVKRTLVIGPGGSRECRYTGCTGRYRT